MPVNLVTIHHEGAGAPSDNVTRFAHGGYSYGIGLTRWERFRSPERSWGTLNFNHKSMDICLSGNRMTAAVTDSDIVLIHGAFLDCHKRGEITATPQVRDHHDSPGSNTVCSGNNTRARWSDVANACRAAATIPPPPTTTPPPARRDVDMQVVSVKKDGAKPNEQPFCFLDATARKIWGCWGVKINWDGVGNAAWSGAKDPKSTTVPGTAPLVGMEIIERIDSGRGARFCVYGMNGAEYNGTASG